MLRKFAAFCCAGLMTVALVGCGAAEEAASDTGADAAAETDAGSETTEPEGDAESDS